ncbi:MAG TPA: hypothetical protein ACFYEK_01365 [Candidatus Wunengus sp. YC60]|uniref:hypothetical protein n=1 Tax=Candidatus Wunengus sp. YC60 TaxID=3367697 RepID=UPI004029BE8E
MPQVLIPLTVTKRNGKTITAQVMAFYVDDIISPLMATSKGGSTFTTRGFKSRPVRESGAVDQVIWEVDESLSAVAALSVRELKKLTVIRRRNKTYNSVPMTFVLRRVQEASQSTTKGGVRFMYSEDGDPLPVEYEVSDNMTTFTT